MLSLCLFCGASAAYAASAPSDPFAAAVAARAAGDSARAIALLEPLLAAHPDDSDLLLQYGLALRAQGRLAESRAALTRGARLAPGDPDLRTERARIRIWEGDAEGADADLDAALAVAPAHVEALALKARLALGRGDPQDARRWMQRLDAIGAADAGTDLLRADLAWLGRDRRAAHAALERAWKASPQDSDWLDRCCRRMGRYRDWSLDVGAEASRFSRRPVDSWRESRVRIERGLADGGAVWGSVTEFDRFDARDTEFRVGGSQLLSPSAWGWIEASATPDARFRADRSLALGGEWAPGHGLDEAGRITWVAGVRLARYGAGDVSGVDVGGRYWLTEASSLLVRADFTRDEQQRFDAGWTVRGDHWLGNGWHVFAGYADAADTVAGTTRSTRSVFGGLSLCIVPRFEVSLSAARDDREHSYLRESLNLGLRVRW